MQGVAAAAAASMSPEDATNASATTAAMSAEGTSRRCGIATELLNPLNNKQPIKPPGHRITRQLVPSRQDLADQSHIMGPFNTGSTSHCRDSHEGLCKPLVHHGPKEAGDALLPRVRIRVCEVRHHKPEKNEEKAGQRGRASCRCTEWRHSYSCLPTVARGAASQHRTTITYDTG